MRLRIKNLRMNNQSGQGMIEYMILVALIAIGTLGVVKVVGQNVSIQYENINRALGAKKAGRLNLENADDKHLNRKDLSNFMDGTRSGK